MVGPATLADDVIAQGVWDPLHRVDAPAVGVPAALALAAGPAAAEVVEPAAAGAAVLRDETPARGAGAAAVIATATNITNSIVIVMIVNDPAMIAVAVVVFRCVGKLLAGLLYELELLLLLIVGTARSRSGEGSGRAEERTRVGRCG